MTASRVSELTSTKGLVLAALNSNNNRLAVTSLVGPFSSRPTSVHIHGPSENGPNEAVIFDVGNIVVFRSGEGYYGTFDVKALRVTTTQFERMLSGEWYVDVHTVDEPDGEVRGSLSDVFARNASQLVRANFDISETGMNTILAQIEQNEWRDEPNPDADVNDLVALRAAISRHRAEFSWLVRLAIEQQRIRMPKRDR